MGNLWSWFCNNSSKKETTSENEGSYKTTEYGTAEKVIPIDTVEIALESHQELKVVESGDNNESAHKILDVSLNETAQEDKIQERGDEKMLMCTSQDVSMNESFSIDERLPTFVTVPSPTQVKKLQASVRA